MLFTTFVINLVTILHLVKYSSSPIALPVDIRLILKPLPLYNGTTLNKLLIAEPLADIIGLGLKRLCYLLEYYRNGI